MTGEIALKTLIASMTPELHPGEYVFCTCRANSPAVKLLREKAVGTFTETEGVSFIIAREDADRLGAEYAFVAAWITLTVHSSLAAVGLTAAFAKALAEQGVSCNVIAAFYHDHIFVKTEDALKAMRILEELSAGG